MNVRVHTVDNLQRVLDLLLVCESAGYVDMELRSTELRLALANPAFDHQRHTAVIEQDGALLAFALLWQGRYLGMLVHPNGRGIVEHDLIDWAEARLLEDGVDLLTILCRSDDDLLRTLLEHRRYSVDNDELRMARSLVLPLPRPTLSDGFALRTLQLPEEMDAWLALYAEAFGPPESALRKWRAFRADSDYDQTLDLIIVDSDDQIAAACTCSVAAAELAAIHPREGRTEPVMVSSRYRGIGLGRAVVQAGLIVLRDRGIEVASLTTEPDNLIAHHLYESLGYEVTYKALWYQRPLHD